MNLPAFFAFFCCYFQSSPGKHPRQFSPLCHFYVRGTVFWFLLLFLHNLVPNYHPLLSTKLWWECCGEEVEFSRWIPVIQLNMTCNVRNTVLKQGTWLSFGVTGHPVYSHSKYRALHQGLLCNLHCCVNEYESNVALIAVNVPCSFFLSHCHFPFLTIS